MVILILTHEADKRKLPIHVKLLRQALYSAILREKQLYLIVCIKFRIVFHVEIVSMLADISPVFGFVRYCHTLVFIGEKLQCSLGIFRCLVGNKAVTTGGMIFIQRNLERFYRVDMGELLIKLLR